MYVYRITQSINRANDLSGTGAFKWGGRWSNKGTYMLYTSENSSLAYLECLVHFDNSLMPPELFIVAMEISNKAPLYIFPEKNYPHNWQQPGLAANQNLGDKWMNEQRYLGIKVRSAVNSSEYNYLLNPRFPAFHQLVKIKTIISVGIDDRIAASRLSSK
jgi:RES domain-containing protein